MNYILPQSPWVFRLDGNEVIGKERELCLNIIITEDVPQDNFRSFRHDFLHMIWAARPQWPPYPRFNNEKQPNRMVPTSTGRRQPPYEV